MTKLIRTLILFLAAAAGSAFAEGIIIGHTNVMGVAALPQAVMDRVAQFRWFFAHASVGENMMDGITELHSANATRYPLQHVSDDDGTPPPVSECTPSTIYDNARGNPDWTDKVSWFEGYASNGWRNPAVNIALNKFCWIDPYVNTNSYLSSMRALEGRYPDTLFIYMTIPLTGYADTENNYRNAFNRTLRQFCSSNNRVLFDVADIQSHDTNGTAYTYSTTNQLMYGGFAVSEGDWHLNDVARPWVARGFYALGAALLTTDRDGDGMSDGEELIAGMCPTSTASVFKFECPSNNPDNGTVISWPSTSNRIYFLQRTTNLIASASTNLLTNSIATPPMNCYTDSPAGAGPFFYKVGVRQ
jgi:hypothetical protein